MRSKYIPEFTKKFNELFRLKSGHAYLDIRLTHITGKIELDILKLDELLHERHGECVGDALSMSDITIQENGDIANVFLDLMLKNRKGHLL